MYTATPANFVGRIITTRTSAGVLKETITRNFNYIPPYFDRTNNINYLVSFITSINRYSMLQLRFQTNLLYSIPAGNIPLWGKLVFELPTKDGSGATVFLDNLGRTGFTNNQEIDCVCTCGACTTNVFNYKDFICRVSIGANDPSAPVQILIEPQATINPGTLFCLNFPKI